jgi:hypothetical protein
MIEQFISKNDYLYDETEDFTEKGNLSRNLRGFSQLLALEEIIDNTLTYYVKNSEEATLLLKKCVRMMEDRQWNTMKRYLETTGNFY